MVPIYELPFLSGISSRKTTRGPWVYLGIGVGLSVNVLDHTDARLLLGLRGGHSRRTQGHGQNNTGNTR